MLPKEFTGDGASATLPLEWNGAPAGTRSFAVIMHHIPGPGTTKWYWVLYNIPADVTSLPKNVKGIGTLGNNSVNRDLGYAPPHSKGPGPKKYTLTVYALSAAPQINVPPEEVSREVLLAAIKDSTLGTAELNVIYSRGEAPGEGDVGPRPAAQGDREANHPRPDGDDAPPERPRADGGPRRRPADQAERSERSAAGQQTKRPVPGGHTVGLFKNDPKAFAGYTLFAPKHHTLIYLMDNEGTGRT